MLKGIPPLISPDLMHALLSMGHGDEILLADGNYPVHSAGPDVIRLDGLRIPEVLEAVLKFMPLDTFSEYNVFLMDNGKPEKPPIWQEYKRILQSSSEPFNIKLLERFEFYEKGKFSFCIVSTSESSLYANIILKKGVVTGT